MPPVGETVAVPLQMFQQVAPAPAGPVHRLLRQDGQGSSQTAHRSATRSSNPPHIVRWPWRYPDPAVDSRPQESIVPASADR